MIGSGRLESIPRGQNELLMDGLLVQFYRGSGTVIKSGLADCLCEWTYLLTANTEIYSLCVIVRVGVE